jgi:hypothetical protein
VAGTYVDFSTAFTTGPSVSGNLTINLSESNAGGIQAAFDNVRLTSVSSVPEPGTLSAGVAAIGLLLGRSRRRA